MPPREFGDIQGHSGVFLKTKDPQLLTEGHHVKTCLPDYP